MLPRPKCVLITGASSGIGAEIARALSSHGVTLILGGRDRSRLERVTQSCKSRGADVIQWIVELADLKPVLESLSRLDAQHSIDLAVLNAGIGDSRRANQITEGPETVALLSDINFRAPASMATLLAERMATRKAGAICMIGSTAAWTPLPMAGGYSASKAALAHFARSLDCTLRSHNGSVTLATLGFIDTPMSRRLDCRKPFLMSAELAAKKIVKAVFRRKREVIVPWQFRFLRLILLFTPSAVVRFVLNRTRFGSQPYDPEK
jgi:short-subunit dehydrogenase